MCPDRGPDPPLVAAVAESLRGLSFREWLERVDAENGGKALAHYRETLTSNFDSVEQIIGLYTRPLSQRLCWDPRLFDDVGILQEHITLFERWLEAQRGLGDNGCGVAGEILPIETERLAAPEEERRLNPDDGLAYTFPDFTQKYIGKYSQKDIRDYWATLSRCTSKADVPPETVERRRDQNDGRVYTFAEFEMAYREQYSPEDIRLYWRDACKVVNVSEAKVQAAKPKAVECKVEGAPGNGLIPLNGTVHDAGASSEEDFAADDRRVDPSDGRSYNFEEFLRRHGFGLSRKELRHYWATHCSPVVDSRPALLKSYKERFGVDLVEPCPEDEVRRLDPDDIRDYSSVSSRLLTYTLKEFKEKHGKHYAADEIEKYWRQCCHSVLDFKKGLVHC